MNELKQQIKRVKDLQAALDRERFLNRPSIHEKMIEEALPWIEHYDFWCDDCQIDFTSQAYAFKHRLYGDYIATYRANCPECDDECVRHITHRDHDPYYGKSDKINEQRNRYATELLQHENYGFESFYGKPFKEYDDRLKARDERRFLKSRL